MYRFKLVHCVYQIQKKHWLFGWQYTGYWGTDIKLIHKVVTTLNHFKHLRIERYLPKGFVSQKVFYEKV